MYDFIDLVKLGIFVNSLFGVLISAFATIKGITVALDLLKSSD